MPLIGEQVQCAPAHALHCDSLFAVGDTYGELKMHNAKRAIVETHRLFGVVRRLQGAIMP